MFQFIDSPKRVAHSIVQKWSLWNTILPTSSYLKAALPQYKCVTVFDAKLHLVHNFCVLVLLQHMAAPLHDVALCTEMHGWSGSTDGGRRFAILDVVFCTYCSCCLYYTTSKSVQNYLTKLLILHIYIHTQPRRCTDSSCSKMHPL